MSNATLFFNKYSWVNSQYAGIWYISPMRLELLANVKNVENVENVENRFDVYMLLNKSKQRWSCVVKDVNSNTLHWYGTVDEGVDRALTDIGNIHSNITYKSQYKIDRVYVVMFIANLIVHCIIHQMDIGQQLVICHQNWNIVKRVAKERGDATDQRSALDILQELMDTGFIETSTQRYFRRCSVALVFTIAAVSIVTTWCMPVRLQVGIHSVSG